MEILYLNNLPALLVMYLFHGASPPGLHASENAIISAQGASTMLQEACIFKKTIILFGVEGSEQSYGESREIEVSA